jgi:hypothetical protein
MCENGPISAKAGILMIRISGWLAIAAIGAIMLGASVWAWAQVPAEAVVSARFDFAGGPNVDGYPTQSMLPFFCHW